MIKETKDILGITKTKMKMKRETLLDGRQGDTYWREWSETESKSKRRSTYMYCEARKPKIWSWTGITERILKIELKMEEPYKTTTLIVDWAGEDEKSKIEE